MKEFIAVQKRKKMDFCSDKGTKVHVADIAVLKGARPGLVGINMKNELVPDHHQGSSGMIYVKPLDDLFIRANSAVM